MGIGHIRHVGAVAAPSAKEERRKEENAPPDRSRIRGIEFNSPGTVKEGAREPGADGCSGTSQKAGSPHCAGVAG